MFYTYQLHLSPLIETYFKVDIIFILSFFPKFSMVWTSSSSSLSTWYLFLEAKLIFCVFCCLVGSFVATCFRFKVRQVVVGDASLLTVEISGELRSCTGVLAVCWVSGSGWQSLETTSDTAGKWFYFVV